MTSSLSLARATTTGATEQSTRSYTSREVTRLTGITHRQLQWWDEQKIVTPARAGRNRCYSFADLAELRVIRDLRRKGFSLQAVRRVMRFLRKELGHRLADLLVDGAERHLLTDGTSIYLRDSAQGVVDVLKDARQGMFGICLTDTLLELRAKCRGGGRKKHPGSVQARREVAARRSR